jgi:S-(hydroxymethyl)glutathione dehydrogenase/alcohol dehydrogenase
VTTVRAAVLETPQTPLRIETLELDDPRPGEVLVRYGASGVCHSDLHVVDGEWRTPCPVVLGHEGAGTIEAVGDGVTHVAAGDHVVVSWWYPCGSCRQCRRGESFICTGNTAAAGTQADGTSRLRRADQSAVGQYLAVSTFAERAVVPGAAAVPIPAAVPWEVACLIGCGVATGVGAVVNTARVEPGASVAVVGCGGVGLSVIMGAVLAGADPVIAIDLEDRKLEHARALGATHCVRAEGAVRREVMAIVAGGVDYAFEAIGLKPTVELLPRLARVGGTCVMVGMTPDATPVSVDGALFPATGQRLLGSCYGSAVAAVDFPRLAQLYLAGKLPIDRLVSHRIALDEVDDALAGMRRRERARSVILYDA